jgi:hypothetical protein
MNRTGAYMRFGDGDVFLATGKNDLFQNSSEKLRREMNEAFLLKGPGVIKSLIIHSQLFGYEKEMCLGNHLVSDKMAKELLQFAFPFFVGYQIFSPIALHFAATYHPIFTNNFLKILKNNTILFIGNQNTSEEIVIKLFGRVKHIKTPIENSYENIDKIEEEVITALERINKFGIVVIAMGCSGRILIKRLYAKSYNTFYFDFGSLLDGICGNKTRTWLKVTDINYTLLLEDL